MKIDDALVPGVEFDHPCPDHETEIGMLESRIATLEAERDALRERERRYREGLERIRDHPHNAYDHPSNGGGDYGTGIADGHRCAAHLAARILSRHDTPTDSEEEG